MISSNFISNFTTFCVISSFFDKLRRLGILFSTAVRAVVSAKLLMLGIYILTLFTLALKVVLVAKVVISYFIFNVFYLSIIYILFNNIIFYYIT